MAQNNPDIEQAFVALVVSHQAALRAFVLSLLPGNPDAEDVIQDANALIWQKRGDFVIGTNFKAWMFSVARFKVMATWRDQKRRKEWNVPEETLVKLIEQSEEGGSFEDTETRHEVLRECLQQLRPEDRGLILRRYIEEWKLRDLAAEVGRSAESLKVSLHRIRMVLRLCLRRRMRKREILS